MKSILLTALGAAVLACAGPSFAQQDHSQHGTGPDAVDHSLHEDHARHGAGPAPAPGTVKVRLPDAQLLDQNARQVKLASDVVGESIVVIDFVYTTCTTVCPVMTSVFSQLRSKLGERLGREVRLVSVTVDPVRDTPQRLKEYSDTVGAAPGWIWLTGSPSAVTAVLKAFGAYTADFTQHPAMAMVGDARSGTWLRFYGFPAPDDILARVDALLEERARARSTGGAAGEAR
jgi:protein SCO1/2